MSLQTTITQLFEQGSSALKDAARAAFTELREELASGRVRSAEPDPSSPTGWRVNVWVKQGILLGFRFGDNIDTAYGRSAGRCCAVLNLRTRSTAGGLADSMWAKYPVSRIRTRLDQIS